MGIITGQSSALKFVAVDNAAKLERMLVFSPLLIVGGGGIIVGVRSGVLERPQHAGLCQGALDEGPVRVSPVLQKLLVSSPGLR